MQLKNVKDNIEDIDANINIGFNDSDESLNIIDPDNIFNLWEPLDSPVDEDYEFEQHGILFNICSDLLYLIAYPIVFLLNKILFDFKIINKEKLDNLEGSKITVSNHINALDCTMIGLLNFPKKNYFTSLESNFEIPIVKQLIMLLNALPIPKNRKYMDKFIQSIDNILKSGGTVHFYPEGALNPYDKTIRPFKKGAFRFAVNNHVPVVPCVFTYAELTGFRKYIKKKPFIRMVVLDPVYPNMNLPTGEAIEDLKNRVFKKMENFK